MTNVFHMIKLGIVCLLLTACIGVAVRPDNVVSIAKGVDFPLLPSDIFQSTAVITQKVVIIYADKKQQFITRLEVDEQGLRLVAISDLGQKLFSIEYKDKQLVMDKSVFMPRSFDPQFLLADLQLIYWPLAALQSQLSILPLHIVETTEEPYRRVLMRSDRTIIEIDYSEATKLGSDVTFKHLERQYSIHATVIEMEG